MIRGYWLDAATSGIRFSPDRNRVRQERVPGVYHGFLLLWQKFDISREVIGRIADEVRDAFAR